MFDGTNSQFKMTARRQRQLLFKAGNNYIQVYNAMRGYKLGNQKITGIPFTPPPSGQVPKPASALGPYSPIMSDITFPSKL